MRGRRSTSRLKPSGDQTRRTRKRRTYPLSTSRQTDAVQNYADARNDAVVRRRLRSVSGRSIFCYKTPQKVLRNPKSGDARRTVAVPNGNTCNAFNQCGARPYSSCSPTDGDRRRRRRQRRSPPPFQIVPQPAELTASENRKQLSKFLPMRYRFSADEQNILRTVPLKTFGFPP